MRVAILGGGIAGVFTAKFLRARGHEILGIGPRPNYPLASLVLTTSMPDPADVSLALESLTIYREMTRLREVTSVDILPEGLDVSFLSGLGVDYRLERDPAGVRLREGEVALVTRDFLVPVRSLVNRLRRGLGFIGSVGALVRDGDEVRAVVGGREVKADAVVLAAGAANSRVARAAGIALPLAPYQCYVGTYLVPPGSWRLSIGDHVLGWYGRPLVFPLYAAGDGCSRPGEPPPPDYGARVGSMVGARYGWAAHVATRSGLCEVGPGGGPIFGRHPEIENLYVLGGLDGYGSMVGPALARALADLISGEDPGLHEYRLERAPLGEFDPCVLERHDWRRALEALNP
ncbi:MAG: NAD(P)/FAD-dependent oxidoreductase [Conexivisphaera sp.]